MLMNANYVLLISFWRALGVFYVCCILNIGGLYSLCQREIKYTTNSYLKSEANSCQIRKLIKVVSEYNWQSRKIQFYATKKSFQCFCSCHRDIIWVEFGVDIRGECLYLLIIASLHSSCSVCRSSSRLFLSSSEYSGPVDHLGPWLVARHPSTRI